MSKFTSQEWQSCELNLNLSDIQTHTLSLRAWQEFVFLQMFYSYYARDRQREGKGTRRVSIFILTVLRSLGLSDLYSEKEKVLLVLDLWPYKGASRNFVHDPVPFFSSLQLLPELLSLFKNNIYHNFLT